MGKMQMKVPYLDLPFGVLFMDDVWGAEKTPSFRVPTAKVLGGRCC